MLYFSIFNLLLALQASLSYAFNIKEEVYWIPGDIKEIKCSEYKEFYFRLVNSDDSFGEFVLYSDDNIKNFRFSNMQFAVKNNSSSKLFEIKIKTNLEKYLKNKTITRTQWQALPEKPGMSSDEKKIKFALHHSEGSAVSSAITVRGIQKYHMEVKDWPDLGYHFLIGVDGVCYEGRKLCFKGAHVEKHNSGNIGICFLGSFESSTITAYDAECTPQMIKTAAELIAVLATHCGIIISSAIIFHREIYS